jgi:hypothetical protein
MLAALSRSAEEGWKAALDMGNKSEVMKQRCNEAEM